MHTNKKHNLISVKEKKTLIEVSLFLFERKTNYVILLRNTNKLNKKINSFEKKIRVK
jgi:hypothetical protein